MLCLSHLKKKKKKNANAYHARLRCLRLSGVIIKKACKKSSS